MFEKGNKMMGGRVASKNRRFFSLTTSLILILSTLMIGISIQIPDASAATVNHNVGNVDIGILTDRGRILLPITWDVQGTIQTSADPGTGVGFIGLVVDQDNYNHAPGSEDIADGFDTYPYSGYADFTFVNDITLVIDDGTTQKSVASFKNTGTGTGDPDDILINQTVWTVVNKDWAILQWTLVNLKSVPINNVCIGLELSLSQVGSNINSGVGGDSGDDIDGYDTVNNVYWAQDDAGAGDCIGFVSAIVSDPISHYYSEDCAVDYETEYKFYYENDTWLYNRIHAPNATLGPLPGNRSSTVGWNNFTISVGESRTVTLVIAVNDTFNSMIEAFKDAQYYYNNVVTGFCITEFSDDQSGVNPQKIEVYNIGHEPTNLEGKGYKLSVDGGTTFLTGAWNPTIIPTYGYSVFTVVGTPIGPEGDTIGMYQDLGGGNFVLVDGPFSYGQEGIIPDPLDGESVAKWFDTNTATYTDEWLRNASTGPTWGAQNDVGRVKLSHVILNRVMFNPMSTIEEGYVELMYRSHGTLDISNYRIICDEEFIVPSGTILNFTNRFYVLTRSNYPSNFDLDDGSVNGDNVYLYDSNGNLLDMVGWSSSHNKGEFMSRIPDGSGTYQGYDDAASKAAGWIFNQLPSLMITEFFMDGTSAQIEAYNPRGSDKFLDSIPPRWTFDVESGPLTGNWVPSTISRGGYSVFTMTGGIPGDEGDVVRLYHNGSVRDEVSYGIKGVAPDPLIGESTARFWDTTIGRYGNDWARAHTSTFGAQNDVPPFNFSSFVILNEVMFNPSVKEDGFVELYLKSGWLNISGYKIVGDSEYIIPDGTELYPYEQYYHLSQPMDPGFFAALNPSGDNVYLYNKNGSLLDMVGWSSLHVQGTTMCRVPNGNGTRDGFDDQSSIAAGWVFDCAPTIQLIEVNAPKPDKPIRYVKLGDVLYFNLTITNKQSVDDTILIFNTTLNGCPVIILDKTGTFTITEVFVPAGSYINITVMVIPPSSIPFIERDNVIITVQSENNTLIKDSIIHYVIVYTTYYWIIGQSPIQTHVYLYARDGANVTFSGTIDFPVIISVPPDQFVWYNIGYLGYTQAGTEWYFLEMYSYKPLMVNFDRAVYLKTGASTYEWKHGDQLHNMPLTKLSTIYYIPRSGSGSGDDCIVMYAHEPTQVTVRILGNSGGVWTKTVTIDGLYDTGYLSSWLVDIAGYSIKITADKPIAAANFDELGWWPDVCFSGYFFAHATYTELYNEYMHVHVLNDPATEYHCFYTPTANTFEYYDYSGNLVNTDTYPTEASRIFLYSNLGYSGSPDPFLVHVNTSEPYADTAMSPTQWYINNITAFMGWNSSLGTLEIYTDQETHIWIYNGRDYTLKTEFDMAANTIFRDTLEKVGFEVDQPFLVVVVSYVPVYQAVRVPFYVRPYPAELAPPVVPHPLPPTLYINTSQDGEDAILYWDPPSIPGIDHYLIYRSTSQTNFDFNTVWKNTSADKEPGEPSPIPLRTMWNDTKAALPGDSNYREQYYYVIRAVSKVGEISRTSRTVGKWTKVFSQGISTFSLPLQPLDTLTVDHCLNNMNAKYIKWMHPGLHRWMKHGDGCVNDTQMKVGEGYEVIFDDQSTYTFTGMPGAMVIYDDDNGFLGFDHATEAKNLTIVVEPNGDTNLTWQEPASMGVGDWYEVYYSNERDGFFKTPGVNYFLVCPPIKFGNNTVTHQGAQANNPGARLFYMVVPFNASGVRGASTYSIGIWTEEYLLEYDTIGIPLKLSINQTADWYCDNIPDTVGINYFIYSEQRWGWHSKRMPSGAYDPFLVMTEGYQISTSQATKFTFIGI